MCKSKTTVNDPVDMETTNVGFLNVSETSESLGEILSTIILVLLVGLIVKWCCKRYHRSSEQQQRNLEQMIRHNAGLTAQIYAQQPPQVQEMMQMVSFQQPGKRRVVMGPPRGSHWEAWK